MENKTVMEMIAKALYPYVESTLAACECYATFVMVALKSNGYRITKEPTEGGGTDTRGLDMEDIESAASIVQSCGYSELSDRLRAHAGTKPEDQGPNIMALLTDATRRGFNSGMAYLPGMYDSAWAAQMIDEIPKWVMQEAEENRLRGHGTDPVQEVKP